MCMFSGAALATNGYFTHGVGSESKGMAGTGILVFSFDTFNPHGLLHAHIVLELD